MTDLDHGTTTLRLLAGTESGNRLSLSAHHAIHGTLQIPSRKQAGPWRDQVLDRMATARLTGRGGGGFPTAIKLTTSRRTKRRPVMVINLMEGEPAAQKDSVLACFTPHLILDGAEALATIVDAVSITVAIARDNPAAIESIEAAIAERERSGLARFDIKVATPPGRYVAGEESALVSWLDGGDARPTFRATKPAEIKIKSRPAVVDNAETAAQTALLARLDLPIPTSLTTLVTISGAVSDPGVFEVTLGEQVGRIVARARPLSSPTALLLGGFGGTFVPAAALDEPYSPDGLRPLGGNVGAGVIVVFDERSCGVAELARLASWMGTESAGQCGPCVFGLPAIAADLELLASRRPDHGVIDRIAHRCDLVVGRGACAHPDGVVRMVSSGLRVFAADAAEHALGRGCSHGAARSRYNLPAHGDVLEWR